MDMKEKLVELISESLQRHIGKSCNLAENIADDLIADGVTVQDGKDNNVPTKWISVKDRLPEEVGQPVLVFAINCYDQTAIVKAFLDYDACGFFRTNEKEYDGIWGAWEVTHWMPLPQPPKGD